MDGQYLKKVKVNFIYELLGPKGPIPLGYTKHTISDVIVRILEDEVEGPSTTFVSSPDTPSDFWREEPMLIDTIIERNKNFNWFPLNELDGPSVVKKDFSNEFFVCMFEANHTCSLFEFFGKPKIELEDYFTPKLLKFIKQCPNFRIVFMDVREGAYHHTLNLIEKINRFLVKHNINHGPNKVIVTSSNDKIYDLKKQNVELFKGIGVYNNNYNIVTAGRFITEVQFRNHVIRENGYDYTLQDELNLDKKEKHFLMYNRNTSRMHRPWFVYNLYKSNLLDKGLVSLLQIDDYDELIKRIGTDDGLGLNENDINELRENTPNFYPRFIDEQDGERVANFHNFLSRKDEYEKTYFTIVSETNVSRHFRFLTEKTIKPIMNFHPFIIFGNPGSIKQLQGLGFKTFSNFWDESYDTEIDFKKRTKMILEQVEILTNKSFEEWNQMSLEMEPILRHNKNILLKMERYKKFPYDLITNLTGELI